MFSSWNNKKKKKKWKWEASRKQLYTNLKTKFEMHILTITLKSGLGDWRKRITALIEDSPISKQAEQKLIARIDSTCLNCEQRKRGGDGGGREYTRTYLRKERRRKRRSCVLLVFFWECSRERRSIRLGLVLFWEEESKHWEYATSTFTPTQL